MWRVAAEESGASRQTDLWPIDCAMYLWSGWSRCTADCEVGLQFHTRSVSTKPKSGGMPCNTDEESRPCNSGSRDRDRTLTKWQKWKPCSAPYGGGMREHVKHGLIPTRGYGKCPTATSEKEVCKKNLQRRRGLYCRPGCDHSC